MAKPHLSISQLNMLSRCGEQYNRRYIKGHKLPPGVSLIVGKAVDKAVTRNLANKMDGKGLLPVEQVADIARDEFNSEWDGSDVALQPEEMELGLKIVKGQNADKSIRLARLHATDKAAQIEPTHLQRRVEVELPGYPYDLLGFLDIQEALRSVRDTKTSGKTPAKDVAEKDDQLTMYAMMVKVTDGAIPEKLCLDYLVDLKTPKSETFETTRTDEDFRPILRRVEAAILALEKGVFIPARESDWWCNPKWCGFHSTCPYVKKPKQFAA